MNEQEMLAMVPATITERHDDHSCALTVAVDLSSLGVADRWEYDSVLSIDDGEVTLVFFPPEAETEEPPPSPRSRDW